MTRHSEQHARVRSDVKNRIAAVVLVAAAFVTIAGWAGEAWSQANVKRVGILTFSTVTAESIWVKWVGKFRGSLADEGWSEGKNVTFEYRSAQSDPGRIAEATAALVALEVDVIFATSAPMLRAAYAATQTIPIVAVDLTTDPVAEGYVQSYARPGGNVTGVFLDAPEFAGKWFELLKALVPELSRVAVLWDRAPGANHVQAVRSVARSLDIQLQILEVRQPDEFDKAFDVLRGPPQAIICLPSPMMYGQSARIAELALKHRLPAISGAIQFGHAGGLLSYGPQPMLMAERVGSLVARILGGARPAELPVERPTKIQLVVNLKTAKALGVTIPQSVLLRADEVIE